MRASTPARPRPVFVDVPTARGMVRREGARLIDARTPRDAAAGRAEGALAWPARDVHPVRNGIRHPVAPEDLREAAYRLGVHDTPVVVYGGKGGADAAHLWWTLATYGHPAAFLLDGGFDAWVDGGGPVAAEPLAERGGGTFVPREGPATLATAQDVVAAMRAGGTVLLDTRSAEEYSGEIAAAARGGHVPGAEHVDWERAVTADGRLRTRTELGALYSSILPAKSVIAYCQSGVRAAHTVAVLQHLGHSGAKVYLGSWGEWGNQPDLPVVRSSSKEVTS